MVHHDLKLLESPTAMWQPKCYKVTSNQELRILFYLFYLILNLECKFRFSEGLTKFIKCRGSGYHWVRLSRYK
jgi:hypothetical protein